MPVEWVNRRAGESAKRRTRVETDEKKQHQKPNGRIRETAKKRVRHFRDLDVYQNALETALRVYELSKKFPDGERYALIDQIRRSSRSVCANIAEGWRKRRYEAAFVSKLSDSDTEAAETEVHLSFARDCGYLAADLQQKLQDHYDHICRQLTNMMNDAGSWCGTGSELREIPPEYVVKSQNAARSSRS